LSKPTPKQIMPMITVDSVDDIRTFYVERLGFEHVMGVVGKDGQLDFCTVLLGGARVMFTRSRGQAPSRKPTPEKQPVEIYLEVADVTAYHDRLKKAGIPITDPLTNQWWGDRTFKVMDPYGYEIWFYQTVGEVKPPEGAKIV
jgi:uncharacterized glyoxalase superfamily protein PhnB